MRKLFLISMLFLLMLPNIKAQYVGVYQVNEGNCDFFIKDKNWPEGVKCFSQLLNEEPNNIEVKYKLAKCYTFSNIDKAKAIQMLQELKEQNFEAEDFEEVLAWAYFYNHKFDESKVLFNELAKNAIEANTNEYEEMAAQCDRSKSMQKRPVSVSFENLGKNINSKAPDFLPVVSSDEAVLYFTTKREGVVGNLGSSEGYKTADIFTAKHKRNKYSRARSVGSPNTLGNEFTGGRSENGKYLVYNVNNETFLDDIFISEKGRRSYGVAKLIKKEELRKTSERGATLSNDGERMYFSSDRLGGLGGYDIYYIQRLPNGDWGDPVNLGTPINTEKDEQFPFLTNDGNSLYFSSNGHPGMGGMDLFKSIRTKSSAKWTVPVNLGYPINGVEDDWNISFAANERYAYIAKKRPEGFGDMDIYRITFEEERSEYTLVSGSVMKSDSSLVQGDITIEIFDFESRDLVGSYVMNASNSSFNAILPPGKYSVEVFDAEGFQDYEKTLVLLGKNDFVLRKKFDIILISP